MSSSALLGAVCLSGWLLLVQANPCGEYGGITHHDGQTCCAASCGKYCGAADCQAGGALLCCAIAIPATQICGNGQKAPCTLAKAAATRENPCAPTTKVVCYGFEEEWGLCNKNTCRDTCKARDCTFNEWAEWTDMGGCVGLASRTRTIKEANNECGAPCNGTKYETKDISDQPTYKDTCIRIPVDCKWSDWAEWSRCANKMDQRYSQRAFVRHPENGGNPCVGEAKKTSPCTDNPGASNGEFDCKLSNWMAWSSCSRSCDGGHKTRSRRVTNETRYGGEGCTGSISQTHPCAQDHCDHTKNCTFTDWQEWTSCTTATENGPFQRYRTREIDSAATGAGLSCIGQVKEAAACNENDEAEDCKFEEWQAWGKCTASCGGGQKYRNRDLLNSPKNGGKCLSTDMQETHGCNTNDCPLKCEYSSWTDWSKCTPACGAGIQTQDRTVTGYDCKGPTKVVRNCSTECKATDCKWSDWDSWSVCSMTCGGGTHTRARKVTQTPENGGKSCEPFTTSEIGACKNVSCGPECKDGTWSEWTEWSSCSVTCQSGYQTRQRQVDSAPNHCGKPALGLTVEVKKCTVEHACVKEVDCELSSWSEWGNCLRDCFGVQERSRHISQYARGFFGKACENSVLKTIQPCNPAEGEPTPDDCKVGPKSVDCKLADWGKWSDCSVKCGPGQKERVRGIDQFPESNGKACNDALKETDRCEVTQCEKPLCDDCKWGEWSEWGQCMGKCEGQMYRHRNIAQLANWCGKNCTEDSAMETAKCAGNCEKTVFCTWADWETTSQCDEAACGPRTRREARSLQIVNTLPEPAPLSNGTKYQKCHGNDRRIRTCPFKSCSKEAVDCEFADWGEWSDASCSQLCERARSVKTMNAHGGKACDGPIRSTKVCKKDCEKPVDCVLSDWTAWSTCASENGQSFRMRSISKMMEYGGKICSGNLQETKWCTELEKPVDCVLDEWASWGDCTVSCGGGSRDRKREIKADSQHGGNPCKGTLEQVEACADKACESKHSAVDCALSEWTEWKGDVQTAQKQRDREVQTQPLFDGKACQGSLQEVSPIDPVDCTVSQWSDWDECDRPCENGQHQRKRQVDQHPRFGGKACEYPLKLLVVEGCIGTDKNCDADIAQDAQVESWSDWGTCTTTCGAGQETRSRTLVKDRGSLGHGFTGELKETRQCADISACASTDCMWHEWSEWNACTKVCEGGEQTRSREIKQAPAKNGKPCEPLSAEEVRPCNTDACDTKDCVNGVWNDWAEWGACSASCLGGVQRRQRTVKTFSNYCGKPAEGDDREYRSCNAAKACTDTDCTFSGWDEWAACMDKCDGVTRRQRIIATMGSGAGEFCEGGLTEVRTCNPSGDTPGCAAAVKTDCEWSEWTNMECSAKCGRADRFKKRTIKTKAAFGGTPCTGAATLVEKCELKECEKPTPIDCKWGVWSQWSACSKCGGQRNRFRDIVTAPQHGGKACEEANTTETRGCLGKELCHKTYCVWTSWQEWGECSKKCDTGKRMRRRNLHETSEEPKETDSKEKARLFNTYQELQLQLQEKSGERWQELVIAFCGGCVSFIVLGSAIRFGMFRLRSSGSGTDSSPSRTTYTHMYLHPEDQQDALE